MKPRKWNRHHRFPRGHPKRTKEIVWVRIAEHRAFHVLFPNWWDVHEIARILNEYFIRTDYILVVRRRNAKDGRD